MTIQTALALLLALCLPFTLIAASTEVDSSAPPGMSDYTLIYVDPDGAPVEGLIANICDDSACMPMFSDATGVISYQLPAFTYHVQVIRVPKGYAYDLSEESYLDEGGGTYTFTVQKN